MSGEARSGPHGEGTKTDKTGKVVAITSCTFRVKWRNNPVLLALSAFEDCLQMLCVCVCVWVCVYRSLMQAGYYIPCPDIFLPSLSGSQDRRTTPLGSHSPRLQVSVRHTDLFWLTDTCRDNLCFTSSKMCLSFSLWSRRVPPSSFFREDLHLCCLILVPWQCAKCVCVCVREREREWMRTFYELLEPILLLLFSPSPSSLPSLPFSPFVYFLLSPFPSTLSSAPPRPPHFHQSPLLSSFPSLSSFLSSPRVLPSLLFSILLRPSFSRLL